MSDPFIRYLTAKRTVDDRALNRPVWQRLVQALPGATASTAPRLLEIGAGIGTMIERLIDWRLVTTASMTAIDASAASIAAAREGLPVWAGQRGLVTQYQPTTARRSILHIANDDLRLAVELEAIDLADFIAREQGRQTWDLLLAHAVLDLLNLPTTIPPLVNLVHPGGLLYLTINFDGGTLLQPTIDRDLDDLIECRYHRTMDERVIAGRPSGDSRTGRRLFGHLRAAGATILAAGSSDWVVFAGPAGYPGDEAFFLHFIIDTMHSALANDPVIEPARLAAWITQRHAQIERGELVYVAHQLDLLAERTHPPLGQER